MGELSESYDSETGENLDLYVPRLDIETGEAPLCPCDQETGECSGWSAKPFKIPRFYYTASNKKRAFKKRHRLRKANPQESELITAAIFLLPTMIFFHPILCVISLIIEIVLHNMSHSKNNKLKSDTIFFHRSPLHGILKEFCGTCKEEMSVNKIRKIQDRKNVRFQYLKRVVT